VTQKIIKKVFVADEDNVASARCGNCGHNIQIDNVFGALKTVEHWAIDHNCEKVDNEK
jgi:hypothetical protein